MSTDDEVLTWRRRALEAEERAYSLSAFLARRACNEAAWAAQQGQADARQAEDAQYEHG